MYSADSSSGVNDCRSPSAHHDSQEASALYSPPYAAAGSSSPITHSTHLHEQIAPHLQHQRELEEYQQQQQQQRFARYNHPQQAEQWPPYISYPSAASGQSPIYSTMSPAGLTSPEEEHLLMSASAQPLHLHEAGLSPMEQFFYNEQLMLRMQTCGVEPRSTSSTYVDNLHQTINHTISSSSSEYNIAGRAGAAGRRYEEACTPRPRWSPTQEQIQILESLFNSGTTTPSRDMIVDIAAQLRRYGSIAEANVFYWFQNRKARAKRKQQKPPPNS